MALCVAAFDEALQLRDAGIGVRIIVLYPIPAAWAANRGLGTDCGHGR